MNHETHKTNSPHGDYERRDIGISGVLYFLLALVVAGGILHFVVTGFWGYLNRNLAPEQAPPSPLVTNAPTDTRRIPPQYNEDYQKYLNESFPAPQLEINERTELNEDRLREENTLSTYGWVDQKAGTVRIPIDRAMDLLAQRGLPVRQAGATEPATQTAQAQQQQTKGRKK
jgi:hypothetical protein